MAWNEPGNNGNDPDPWGSGGGRRGGGNQGPPDIDEVIKNLLARFGILGGGAKGGSGGPAGTKRPPGKGVSGGLLAGFVVVALVVWGFLGFYMVDEAERAVVLRFGRVLDNTVGPGLHWNPPLIDEVNKVNVSELNAKTYQNRAMLTTDENIIDIVVTVQYRIDDPVKYVIAVQDPERSLDNASESATRHVVGGNFMDQILNTPQILAAAVHERLQDYMDLYNTGIFVSQVNVTDAQPPEAVRDAFEDVIRAREDEQRSQNQAQQYANRVIPEARGEAQRQIEQANAYKEEVIARAEGDASRFDQLLLEYQKAPEVTRQRMYIDSIQDVMTASSKIMIDVEGGNNMLYVPLDKILEQNTSITGAARPRSAAEWRDFADELVPYLPNVSGGAVDASRLSDARSGVTRP